jgi:succinate dehydrogenase/fumarate reductase flavoprotein subunit
MGDTWDRSVEMVVIGFGGAGAAAALAGADLGATVLVLEKQPRDRHTPSTAMSGGIVMATNDVERATVYLDRCAGGMIPLAVSRAWAFMAADLVGWLDRVGADLALERVGGAEHPEFEGAEAIESWAQSRPSERVPPGTMVREHKPGAPVNVGGSGDGGSGAARGARRIGFEYFAGLRSAVALRSEIGVLYETPARHLIQDEDGRVIGVLAEVDGRAVRIRASRGVVLTTGGYEFSDEMKINYLKASPMYFYGNPGNTGDGVRMAQEAGADLWHMNQMVGRAIAHFELDGRELNFVIGIHPPGYVITDKYGRRFANEYPQAQMKHSFYYELLAYDAERNEYPRNPCYWFFDQRHMTNGPMVSSLGGTVGAGYYDWSPDNSREVARGWIKQADSVSELAALAGFASPSEVVRTVALYNQGCAAGQDAFGRPAESLVPLDSPPYYCMPLYPGGPNTCGGPRRDEHARILTPFGRPIPGLYGAGELGEAVGLLYPANGGNLSESVCFGRIAAEHALGSLWLYGFMARPASMYSTVEDISSWAEIAPAGVNQRSRELAVPMARRVARCGSPGRMSPCRCPSPMTSVISSW